MTIQNEPSNTSIRFALRDMGWTTSSDDFFIENDKKIETRYTFETLELRKIGIWLIPPSAFCNFHIIIKDNISKLNVYESWGTATDFQITSNLKKDIIENLSNESKKIDKERTRRSYFAP